MDDATLALELDASPDKRRRQFDEMSRSAFRRSERPIRPHRYALHADDGALYETTMVPSRTSTSWKPR